MTKLVTRFGDSITCERQCPALKRLASAVQLRPWPPCFKGFKSNHQKFTSPVTAQDSGHCAQFTASLLDCRMASSICP